VDVARFNLRAMAETRWGGDVSPFFEGQLTRLEEAIALLDDDPLIRGYPWPPAPLPPPTVPYIPPGRLRPGEDLTDAGVAAIASSIAAGVVSAEEVAEAFLQRAARLDPMLHVWAALDPERVRTTARWRDQALREGDPPRPLAGVPIGVKDIFNTDDYPTAANSRVPPSFVNREDALCVSYLAIDGDAIILGKTATTEYAYADPSEARNPWNPAHTPGGSSSGSAAGVAARLMPAGLGTQTAGSVIRPAAFCGVVGFKPTTERISRLDVLPLAHSLDHVGTLTRSVADAALLYRVMTQAAEDLRETVPRRYPGPWRLALWPDLLREHTDEATRAALRMAGATLERAGADITLVSSESEFCHTTEFWERVLAVHAVIMAAEVSANHLDMHPDRIHDLGPRLRAIVEAGALVPAQALLRAQDWRWQYWWNWHELSEAKNFDAVLVPSAPGTAPEGLQSTGDPSLNAPWTLFGVPSITIPITVAANGLPLGMQIVAPYGEDARLLAIAEWCESAIGFTARPNLDEG
jgi:Asp-tRNA(Asn)/Glu-tRNA(Gln) amidotransferase A subunit family amidase